MASMVVQPVGYAILGHVFGGGLSGRLRHAPDDRFRPPGAGRWIRQAPATSSDVRTLLGPPAGDGATRHMGQEKARTIWFYEYGRFKGDKVALKIILVFFNGDIYEGHLWFSAKELVKLDWS